MAKLIEERTPPTLKSLLFHLTVLYWKILGLYGAQQIFQSLGDSDFQMRKN